MVTGEDLINAGLVPDKRFSAMLKRARELRFAGLSKERALDVYKRQRMYYLFVQLFS